MFTKYAGEPLCVGLASPQVLLPYPPGTAAHDPLYCDRVIVHAP
jgi:hypothetical protein